MPPEQSELWVLCPANRNGNLGLLLITGWTTLGTFLNVLGSSFVKQGQPWVLSFEVVMITTGSDRRDKALGWFLVSSVKQHLQCTLLNRA